MTPQNNQPDWDCPTGFLNWCKKRVDVHLELCFKSRYQTCERLFAAMEYAVLGGGKRLRPALVILACDAVGGNYEDSLPAAAAIEMIHTYSLIHDDLPCMDDDDYRRGRLTVHKKFDEATAVLAGDALHALAFELLADSGGAQAVREVARFIGTDGILGGQMDDLQAEGHPAKVEQVTRIHLRKTAALIIASLRTGGIIGQAAPEDLTRLTGYGKDIGLAFQIIDDLLDEEGSTEQLGKPAGSDRAQQKATYPAAVGLSRSRQKALALAHAAGQTIAGIPRRQGLFIALADYLVTRDR